MLHRYITRKYEVIIRIIYKGSYMSTDVLLNLLNKLRKRDKMRGYAKHLIAYSQQVNKFQAPR